MQNLVFLGQVVRGGGDGGGVGGGESELTRQQTDNQPDNQPDGQTDRQTEKCDCISRPFPIYYRSIRETPGKKIEKAEFFSDDLLMLPEL